MDEKKKEKEWKYFDEEAPGANKPLIVIIVVMVAFVAIFFLLSNPELMNRIFGFFYTLNPDICHIDNDLKNFLYSQATEYRENFPYKGIESGFKISYLNIIDNYSVCYTGNFVCTKTTGDLFQCKAVIMPFEIFCFRKPVALQNGTQDRTITCVREFIIDNRTLEVTSINCERPPEFIKNNC